MNRVKMTTVWNQREIECIKSHIVRPITHVVCIAPLSFHIRVEYPNYSWGSRFRSGEQTVLMSRLGSGRAGTWAQGIWLLVLYSSPQSLLPRDRVLAFDRKILCDLESVVQLTKRFLHRLSNETHGIQKWGLLWYGLALLCTYHSQLPWGLLN